MALTNTSCILPEGPDEKQKQCVVQAAVARNAKPHTCVSTQSSGDMKSGVPAAFHPKDGGWKAYLAN